VLAAREALEARHDEDRQIRTARAPASQRVPNIRFWNAFAPQRRTIGGVPNGGSGMQTVPMVGNGAVEELLEESAGGGPEQDAQPGTPAATPQGVST
jgi:hypothetical protein